MPTDLLVPAKLRVRALDHGGGIGSVVEDECGVDLDVAASLQADDGRVADCGVGDEAAPA